MQLSLDCLTLTTTAPPDVIRSAAAAGYDLVSLWAQPPAAYDVLLMTPAHETECRRVMADTGVGLFSLEVFNLVSQEANQTYRPALELGARLGQRRRWRSISTGRKARRKPPTCWPIWPRLPASTDWRSTWSRWRWARPPRSPRRAT